MRQAAILVGGSGTRLGSLAEGRPKPFIEIGGKPFVDYLIQKAKSVGIEEILLLAGHASQWITDFYQTSIDGINIRLLTETEPMGTAGALAAAADSLDDVFLLLNGDSILDGNWASLMPLLDRDTSVAMALRDVNDTGRYGRVDCDGDQVVSFHEKDPNAKDPGQVNAGVYLIKKKALLPLINGPTSLEQDVLPKLVSAGAVKAASMEGYFIDIGLPSSLEQAKGDFPAIMQKPAVIFDRDNTLIRDAGYTHKVKDLDWIEDAIPTICSLNNAGIQVFVATNQAGIARGLYTEADMHQFHKAMQAALLQAGGHIDGFYFCPHHPEGTVKELSIRCECRKPGTGMLESIAADHALDKKHCLLVGDKTSDLEAADAFGIKSLQYKQGSLASLIKAHSGLLGRKGTL
ncbi:MAG: HAD-IIIA family hydrolase [Kordiimonadaceae bacterium]|nr:HAD-IIIA family hydrolase [Kordiimonadaceae bacterium]